MGFQNDAEVHKHLATVSAEEFYSHVHNPMMLESQRHALRSPCHELALGATPWLQLLLQLRLRHGQQHHIDELAKGCVKLRLHAEIVAVMVAIWADYHKACCAELSVGGLACWRRSWR
jgi:hypothetical protein